MSNERGQYGRVSIGQSAPNTIYVQREASSSIGKWLLGAVAIGGAVLWARHQSQQIDRLTQSAGLPRESFTAGLRESARELPTRARSAFRSLTGRVRPARPAIAAAESGKGED